MATYLQGFPDDIVEKLQALPNDVQRPDQDITVTVVNKTMNWELKLYADHETTMLDVQSRFAAKTSMDPSLFRLGYNGKTISDELYRRVGEYAGGRQGAQAGRGAQPPRRRTEPASASLLVLC